MRHVFPYFGGKKRVAPLVWDRFIGTDSYLEPFGGSLAVALDCPWELKHEILNDLDGFVCNFWRAVACDPESVARAADWPVSHLDLTARHSWLRDQRERLTALLVSNPNYYNAEIAGVWVWGISAWIGGRWCDSKSTKRPDLKNRGVHAFGQWPTIKEEGCNSRRQRPRVRDAIGERPHLVGGGFYDLYQQICLRLRNARLTCCDWRSLKSSVGISSAKWAVFLDPPYTRESGRRTELYAVDDLELGHEVAEWARELAEMENVVVALCGLEGEHDMPGFDTIRWNAAGYARSEKNKNEVIWVSERITQQRVLI